MCLPLRQIAFNHILIFTSQLPTSHFGQALAGEGQNERTHMRIIREAPLPVSPRASAIPQAKNFHIAPERSFRRIVGTSKASAIPQTDNLHPTLTTQQIFKIARIFDPIVEDELGEARTAWRAYQSSRRRDAVYPYLTAVAKIVRRWKKQYCAKAKSHQALRATGHRTTIRSLEPFAIVIFCTSDLRIVDAKSRSKWSRALRYAERFKPDSESITSFIKRRNGINEVAAQFSKCISSPENKTVHRISR